MTLIPTLTNLERVAFYRCPEIHDIIEEGGKSRTIAATNMNSESSRSHAVFTVLLTQESVLYDFIYNRCLYSRKHPVNPFGAPSEFQNRSQLVSRLDDYISFS